MRFERWEKHEFNGYLNSLRYICDKKGVDFFSLENECKLNRVQKLYSSNLHGSNYILPLLWADGFDDEFQNLLEKNKSLHHRKQRDDENKKLLFDKLKKARKDFCGIGTKKVKLMLNQIGELELGAQILRVALEIEDCSIQAKNYTKEFAEYKYYEKENLLYELMELCSVKGIKYGFKDSDIPSMKSIIFFDMPFAQLSWHSKIDKNENLIYDDEWDGLECSTLDKLESFIMDNYKKELEEYNG